MLDQSDTHDCDDTYLYTIPSRAMDPTGGKSDRLLRLYPKVDENETPLPRAWNPKDKYTYLGLSNNNLKVHYKGRWCCYRAGVSDNDIVDTVDVYLDFRQWEQPERCSKCACIASNPSCLWGLLL